MNTKRPQVVFQVFFGTPCTFIYITPIYVSKYLANMSAYSHYVFSALDVQDTGVITFQVYNIYL